MWNKNKMNKHKHIDTENRVVITREEGGFKERLNCSVTDGS